MEFLDNIFDKIENEIEWGTKKVVNEPGKVAVDIVDTALMQNNPYNPVGWVGNAIRSGIGSAGLKGEGIGVLTRGRDSEGNIRSNAWDYFLKQDTDKLNAAGLSAAKGAEEYKVIGNEGYSYVDPTTGKVRTVQDLDRASSILKNPNTQAALVQGAKEEIDPFKDSQTKITNAGKLAGLNNKATAKGILPENLSDNSAVAQQQLIAAIDDNDWQQGQDREANSYRETTRKKERGEDLIRQTAISDRNFGLQLQTLTNQNSQALASLKAQIEQAKMTNEQSVLDREYLDRRDQRDYDYRIKKDDQESMDKIFALLIGGIDKIF